MKIPLIITLLSATVVHGATFYVDNVKGLDSNPGTEGQPFKSIEHGIRALKTSDRLEVMNNPGHPYSRPYPGVNGQSYFVGAGGTEEKPLVINGNGAVISGLAVVPAEKWEAVEKDIYRLPFWPMSNRYRGWKKNDCWMENLQIWFVDGKPAANAKSRTEMLAQAGSFWWNRSEKMVYFHLPQDRALEALCVQLPANAGFYALKSFTTIENFAVIHSWNDGFDTALKAESALYRNCIAISNCGQGFSAHEATTVTYEKCLAMNCGSAGISNVNSSRAEYVRCVIADNVFEPGVSASQNAFIRMTDSLILNNTPDEQCAAYGKSSIELENCIIRGAGSKPMLFFNEGGITLRRCTAVTGSSFYISGATSNGTLKVTDSIIGNFQSFLRVRPNQDHFGGNLFFDMPSIVHGEKRYDFSSLSGNTTLMDNSLWVTELPRHSLTGLPQTQDNRGAAVPADVWELYWKYQDAKATPAGLIFFSK